MGTNLPYFYQKIAVLRVLTNLYIFLKKIGALELSVNCIKYQYKQGRLIYKLVATNCIGLIQKINRTIVSVISVYSIQKLVSFRSAVIFSRFHHKISLVI